MPLAPIEDHRLIGLARDIATWMAGAKKELERLPPFPGYEQFFVDLGMPRLVARFYVYFFVDRAMKGAAQLLLEGKTIPAAIKRLATKAQRAASVQKVALKLAKTADIEWHVERVFERHGRQAEGLEISQLLAAAARGDSFACMRLREISVACWKSIPVQNGRPVTYKSIAHEWILRAARPFGWKNAPTWDPFKCIYSDVVSRAAASAFGPNFTPKLAGNRSRKPPIYN